MKFLHSKTVQLIIIVVGALLILNFSRDILKLLKAGDRLKEAEEKVTRLEKEHQALQEKREFYASEEFVEQEARNKLNMARPGETIVILPPNVKEILGHSDRPQAPDIPNWQKWWKLFF